MNEYDIFILMLFILFIFPALSVMLPIHCISCNRRKAAGNSRTYFSISLPLRTGFYTWFSLIVFELLVKLEWTYFLVYFHLYLLPLLLIYYFSIYTIIYILTIIFKFIKKVLFSKEFFSSF